MENNQNAVTQPENKEEKTEEAVDTQATKNKDEEETKTFTQEEVNSLLAKERKKMPSKEDLDKFNEWRESQKTEAEKQSELTQKMSKYESDNLTLKQENQILKSGVSVEDADYVAFKVGKMEGDFEDNLKEFLKENPKYLQKKEEGTENQDSGTSVKQKINKVEDGAIAILKAKHPDAFK